MISAVRLLSHQLSDPRFNNPKDLVAWMGAIQAQDYNMAKWAIGIRTKNGTLQAINKSLESGELIRTHIMRPTWHIVAAEDLRWMLKLSRQQIKKGYDSFVKGKGLDIPENLYSKCNKQIEKILEGNKSLTKQEIGVELSNAGINFENKYLTYLIIRAEAEGILCSGIDKKRKQTYALLDERIPFFKELHKEEAIAKLAVKYFQSHSPASLNDFVWWSGLSITNARNAIYSIEKELIKDTCQNQNLFIHESYSESIKHKNILHLLPSFDEYLISYKERNAVIRPEHCHKAFNKFGTFYPVILYNGKIIGNWKKSIHKEQIIIDTSFFEPDSSISEELMEEAKEKYKIFISK